VHRYRDWNDNLTHHFTITKFHDRIAVSSRSLVHTQPLGAPIGALTDRRRPRRCRTCCAISSSSAGPVKLSPGLRAAHRSIGLAPTAPLGRAGAGALGAYIHERFEYRKNVTSYDSTTEDFLKIGAGVLSGLRPPDARPAPPRQIPCRYVSGYLHIERKKREPSQSHAWIELYSATSGWVPFDPTHNRTVDERYVVVGHGRHYDDVPPNKGIFRGIAKETLKAEIFTEVVPGKVVSTLREEISHMICPYSVRSPGARPSDRHRRRRRRGSAAATAAVAGRFGGPDLRHLALDRRLSSRGSRTRWKTRARRRSP